MGSDLEHGRRSVNKLKLASCRQKRFAGFTTRKDSSITCTFSVFVEVVYNESSWLRFLSQLKDKQRQMIKDKFKVVIQSY